MTFSIIVSVLLGSLIAYYFKLSPNFVNSLSRLADIGLVILLFFVGLDIGRQKGIVRIIRETGREIIVVPLAIIAGSLVGGIISGIILNIGGLEGMALGSGLGWYTLSSTILIRESSSFASLATLAFLSNVFREIIGLIIMPYVAKNIGYLEAVSVAGATAMDTSLPMISATTNAKTSIIAFVSGLVCTISVPLILPLIINFIIQ